MRINCAGFLLIFSLICGEGAKGWAQTNSWTNSGSGNWEQPGWSLGVLPGTNQDVMLTNTGWKALAIGPNTAQNFPETLNIHSLTISSPADSANEVLMNYSGLTAPLTIGSDSSHGILFVESNSSFTMLSSALNINLEQAGIFSPFDTPSAYGAFSVGGAFNESDRSQVTANFLKVGDIGPGIFNLTNSTLTVPYHEIIGGYPSAFNQYGGTNVTAALVLTNSGEYDLYDGTLVFQDVGSSAQYNGQYDLQISFLGGSFNQWGGTVSAGMLYQSGGGYHLAGGTLNVNSLSGVPVLQTGGTNYVNWITLTGGGPQGPVGGYTLQNGQLSSRSVYVGTWQGVNPNQLLPYQFYQSGGAHVTASVNVVGAYGYDYYIVPGSYVLTGGSLSAGVIELNLGVLNQSGGTNQANTVQLDNLGSYNLSGGLLVAQNIQCNSGDLYGRLGVFTQSGGTNQAGNITLDNDAVYQFSGGQLTAQNILITESATFRHAGGALNIPGIVTLSEGKWNEQANGVQLGQLQLSGGGNSILSLPAGPCNMQFADSGSLTWSNNATLTIQNWKGSLFGGGQQQVIFGNSAASLNATQLTLIQFANPAGLNPGNYPARILANGEIVPNSGGPLFSLASCTSCGSQLKLLAKAGQTFEIDVSSDFVHWTSWTNQTCTGGTLCITDPDATNHPVRFYRAVVRQ